MNNHKLAHAVSRLIMLAIAMFLCVILNMCLSGCKAEPYWKDQPAVTNPSPSVVTPMAAPIPIFWPEYEVVGTVNIRKEPNAGSDAIGALYPGATVRADCDRKDGWCEVSGGFVLAACLGEGEGKCQAK